MAVICFGYTALIIRGNIYITSTNLEEKKTSTPPPSRQDMVDWVEKASQTTLKWSVGPLMPVVLPLQSSQMSEWISLQKLYEKCEQAPSK